MGNKNENFRILIVDDSEKTIEMFSNILRKESYDVSYALSGKEALELLKSYEYDLILLDVKMPRMNGFEFFKEMKRNDKAKEIPVIFISQLDDPNSIIKGYEIGGEDYITKDSEPVAFLTSIKTQLDLRQKHLELKQKNLELQRKNLELGHKNNELEKEKEKSEKLIVKIASKNEEINELLLNIFPPEIAEQLKKGRRVKPYHYTKVSVLFADFKGFSKIAKKLTPENLIKKLGEYFSGFDKIAKKWEVEKIKTIGDAYMCIGGLPEVNQSNPIQTTLVGLEIQQFIECMNACSKANNNELWEIRMGIHTGEVIAGVVGKSKYSYDVWGDTVNIASRIESKGETGKVNVSEATYNEVKEYFQCTPRGKINAKNIGEIEMYFIERIKSGYSEDEVGLVPNRKFRNIIEELSQSNGI